MFIEVNLSMSNSNSIISAALLDAIWEEQKKGVLDLLLPFAIYILSDNYSENDTISLETVGLEMTRKFGFSHVPNSVIFQVLNMLTKKDNNCLLKKEGSEFILVKDLSAEHEKFDEKYSIVKGSTENFLNSFIEEYNTVNRKKITLEEAKDILLEILNDKGYDVFFEPLELNRITMDSSNKKTFCLAQYIIKVLNDENHKHYKALTGIASGALMSNIVYINTDVNEYKEKPLKDLKIYFDTSLLLFALGFKTAYQKDNMDCILNMLKTNGAELFYFDNNLSELNSILTAYKHRTINSTGQRLEYFDENNIHSNMLDFFIHGLEERLAKIGFKKSSLFEYPRKASEYKYSKYEIIDEAGLKKHLKERIEKYKDEQVSNDVACIASICRERRGRISKTLEKSEAIWVTSNINLLKNTKEFLEFPNDAILPIISVYSLSTEIWLKYGVVDKSVPKQRLYENAQMALEPTKKVVEKCKQKIDELEKVGRIDPSVAALVRYDRSFNKKIMLEVKGDDEDISESLVEREIDSYVDEITDGLDTINKELIESKKELEEENQNLKDRIGGLQQEITSSKKHSEQQIQTQRDKINTSKKEIYQEISTSANNKTQRRIKAWSVFYLLLELIIELFLISAECFFAIWSAKNDDNAIFYLSIAFAALTTLISLYRLKALKKRSKDFAEKHRSNIYSKYYSKESKKRQGELDLLNKINNN